jgi:hypothetical protein
MPLNSYYTYFESRFHGKHRVSPMDCYLRNIMAADRSRHIRK